jgi:hypothetical protein
MAAVEGDELLDYEEETEETPQENGSKGGESTETGKKSIKVRARSKMQEVPVTLSGQLCINLQLWFPRLSTKARIAESDCRLWFRAPF